MGWEINADSFYRMLKKFAAYKNVKDILVTENGAAFKDELKDGEVNDEQRIQYFSQYIAALLRAKNEGIRIKGYFAWTLTDNFEWSEGYNARFGLIHVDFKTQLRTIKNSGYWFRDLLNA
jgi:beta-glucosidase